MQQSDGSRGMLSSFSRPRKEFTMTSPTHRAECSAAALYVGIELSLREWLLTLGPGPAAGRMRVRVRRGIGRPWSTRWHGRRRGSACPGGAGAELLRSGARRILAAPVLDVARRRQSGGGLVEYRGAAAPAAREDGPDRWGEAAAPPAAALGRRAADVAGGARATRRGRMRGTRVGA